jgi:predicted dehydrogenase
MTTRRTIIRRRDLLVSAAVTAAASAAQQLEKKVKIAFLGVSHSHGDGKVSVVRANPAFELAGIWEANAKLGAKYSAAGVKLMSRDEILNDKSIQAVAVESEVWNHCEHARLALEAGKHVHVEKPPADNLKDFAHLQSIAAAKKRIIQVGYMWRYNPGVVKILEAMQNGWLGDIFLLRAMMNTQVGADSRTEWAKFKGGDMFEQGSHLIDFMVRAMGKPSKVTSVLRKDGRAHKDTLLDNTAAILEWPSAMGVLTAAALQPAARVHRFLEVQGTNGIAVLRPIEDPVLAIDLVKAAGPYSAGAQRVQLAQYKRYEGDFEELADCIRKGKSQLPTITPEQDLAIQETLLRASQML